MPGMTVETWFIPKEAGDYEIACAEHCGLGHYRMRGRSTVVPPGDLEATHQAGDGVAREPSMAQTHRSPTPRAHAAARPRAPGLHLEVRLQQGPQGHRDPVLRHRHAAWPGGGDARDADPPAARLAGEDLARPREHPQHRVHATGVMNPEFYAMLFTMHGTIMVFFVLSTAPVSGFGNLLIPLQTGARDMAFPFLNGLSLLDVPPRLHHRSCPRSSWARAPPPAAGPPIPPLSALRNAVPGSQMGQTLWIIGMVFFIASFTMGGLNFVTTILNLRTKGLSLLRMPLTLWSMFLVAILGLLAFPALTAASPDAALRPPLRHELLPPRGHRCLRAALVGPTGRSSTRAARRCSGSTSSGSSAIPRSTS